MPAALRRALHIGLAVACIASGVAVGLVEAQPGRGATLVPAHAVSRAAAPAPTPCQRRAPRTAADYATALNRLPQAGDATLSVPLGGNRVAWIFADTFIPGLGMLHSTVVMQESGCFTATRTQLLPNSADGTYWWPAAAVVLPNHTVLIAAGNGYGRKVRGAIARVRAGRLVFDHWLSYWPQPPSGDGPYFGDGMLLDGATLLVYGTRLVTHPRAFGKELYLASVPLATIAVAHTWHIGTRPIWGALPHGTDSGVAAYHDRNGYHLVTIEDSVFGGGPVISLDSSTPAGPFRVRVLFRDDRPGQFRYNAAVHPEARLADGALLVTVNNNWPLTDTTIHPLQTYQPSFFAAPNSAATTPTRTTPLTPATPPRPARAATPTRTARE